MPADVLQILRCALFCSGLLTASVTDLKSRTIPYTACLLIAGAGLIQFSPAQLWGLLLAIPFYLASGFDRGGAGDILLVAASSFVLGLKAGAAGLILGLSCFVLYCLAAAVVRKIKKCGNKPASYPLAPFLSAGFITVYFI
jgi:leader peptidase (prepilin peptidase)/N-methyltransferase